MGDATEANLAKCSRESRTEAAVNYVRSGLSLSGTTGGAAKSAAQKDWGRSVGLHA